jgi:ATP-dependent DNA helicase PIF1
MEGGIELTPEFINSIEITYLPHFDFKLMNSTIIMLMHTLDILKGMCNGTCLVITELYNNVTKLKT